jgi:hypothetical protein
MVQWWFDLCVINLLVLPFRLGREIRTTRLPMSAPVSEVLAWVKVDAGYCGDGRRM